MSIDKEQSLFKEYWSFRALSVRARRSLCRGPALFVSGPGACSGARRSLCRGPALLVSGPGAPCIGDRRCRGSTLRPGAPLRRLSLEGPGDGVLSVAVRVRAGAPALFVLGPGAPCVGARRSLLPSPHFADTGGLCWVWRLLWPGAFCRGPALLLSVGARRSSALCVGARRAF